MRRAQGEDPSAGRPESREAKVCSVGTSTNSPSFLLLSHFVSSPAPDSAHRQVRSIWHARTHGAITVSDATRQTAYGCGSCSSPLARFSLLKSSTYDGKDVKRDGSETVEGERGDVEDAACLPLCLSELRVFVRHEEALQVNAEVQLAEELGRTCNGRK